MGDNLYVIDIKSGILKWKFNAGSSVYGGSPIISNGLIYLGNSKCELYAIDIITHNEKWKWIRAPGYFNSPFVNDNYIFIPCDADKNLYALDKETGQPKWNFTTKYNYLTSPLILGTDVIIGGAGTLFDIDINTGLEIGNFKLMEDLSAVQLWLTRKYSLGVEIVFIV